MSQPELSRPFSARDISSSREYKITASPEEAAAIAKRMKLPAIARLEALLQLTPWRGKRGLRVSGTITADVTMTCVVSLEPFNDSISCEFDELFVYNPRDAEGDELENPNLPTLLDTETLDVGDLVVEYLALEIDPFPKKTDSNFEMPFTGGNKPEPEEDEVGATNPFAVLEALKKPN